MSICIWYRWNRRTVWFVHENVNPFFIIHCIKILTDGYSNYKVIIYCHCFLYFRYILKKTTFISIVNCSTINRWKGKSFCFDLWSRCLCKKEISMKKYLPWPKRCKTPILNFRRNLQVGARSYATCLFVHGVYALGCMGRKARIVEKKNRQKQYLMRNQTKNLSRIYYKKSFV